MTRKSKKAFTLVELLTVVMIIGILIVALIPAVQVAINKVKVAGTKNMFGGIQQAYEAFKAEYGYYPRLSTNSDRFNIKDNNELFIQTITGKKRNGEPMDQELARKLNKRQRSFYNFAEQDFATEGDYRNLLVDRFGNPNIYVVIDIDGDGIIPANSVDLPGQDTPINAKVAVFAREDINYGFKTVKSWD